MLHSMTTFDRGAALRAAQQAYDENADWATDPTDLTKAKAFVAACRRIVGLLPTSMQSASRFKTEFGINLQAIAQERIRAEQFLAARSGTGVIGFSFENSR